MQRIRKHSVIVPKDDDIRLVQGTGNKSTSSSRLPVLKDFEDYLFPNEYNRLKNFLKNFPPEVQQDILNDISNVSDPLDGKRKFVKKLIRDYENLTSPVAVPMDSNVVADTPLVIAQPTRRGHAVAIPTTIQAIPRQAVATATTIQEARIDNQPISSSDNLPIAQSSTEGSGLKVLSKNKSRFIKGSEEAKEYMRQLREKRKK